MSFLPEEHRREAETANADARTTGKLTLKSGGRTIFLDAKSFAWAEAAGNYVELRASGATHLVRIGLAALGDQLTEAGVETVRIHRSHLVNLAKVAEVASAATAISGCGWRTGPSCAARAGSGICYPDDGTPQGSSERKTWRSTLTR